MGQRIHPNREESFFINPQHNNKLCWTKSPEVPRNINFNTELNREIHNLLHSDSDLDQSSPNDRLSRRTPKMTRWWYISLSQLLIILLSIFSWNHGLVKFLIDFGNRLQYLIDQSILYGLDNLIKQNKSKHWTIKCVTTLPILFVLSIFQTIIVVSVLGISIYLRVTNRLELRMRRILWI